MPRPATAQEEQTAEVESFQAFKPVDIQTLSPVCPVIEAHVIYLGNNPKRSESIPGRVYIDRHVARDKSVSLRVTLSDEGIECYDFASVDNNGDRIADKDGQPVKGKYAHKDYGAMLAGRPCYLMRHAEHVRRFMRMKDAGNQPEFKVFVNPVHHDAFVNYCNRKERRQQASESEYRDTAGLAVA